MNKDIPELLAPAGSMDALKAAVNAGADAVYLAGKQFGARYYADNFDNKQLQDAVNYAHLRCVKVYVTVNTLLNDHELQKMAEYLLFLYEIGIDAILVQDIGVAKLAKKLVPNLKLHASTQMTIHNLEGVKWASEFGFKRVVLAREMELSQIKEISKKIKSEEIELEIFAHGALCYSYSGQCLLSSFIGGRSGNRGMCAQPCRRKYKVISGEKDEYGRPTKLSKAPVKDEYVLSTRDLALYRHLTKIINSDVRSLKIEGRMRSPEYVAIVVSIYRKALDSIAEGEWKFDKEDINNLKLAFNRDFTGGYILEKDYSRIMGRNLPGNRGVYVGSLIEHKKKEALIKIKGDIIPQKGDGIVFIPSNPKEREYGMVMNEFPEIHKNKIKFKVNFPLKKRTSLYITRRKILIDRANEIINGISDDLKNQIMVDLEILIQENGTITLKSQFDGAKGLLKLETRAGFKMEKAVKRPLDKKTIENQMTKTGGTPFNIKKIRIQYPGNLFASLSELNKLRRDLFNEIPDKIISSYLPPEEELINSKKGLNNILLETLPSKRPLKKIPELGIYVNDLNVLNGAINGGCRRIYFDPFIQSSLKCRSEDLKIEKMKEFILEAKSLCISADAVFILKLPKITYDSDLKMLLKLLGQLSKSGINEFMVDGIGTAKALLGLNNSIKLYGSSGLNIWNHLSVEELSKLFNGLTISPELSKNDIKTLTHNWGSDVSLEFLVQGNIESIISKDCIPCISGINKNNGNKFLGLKDVKNRVFPVLVDNRCHTYILNSVELCLIDHLPFISKTGVDTVIIDARGKTEKYAFKICSIYVNALQIIASGGPNIKNNLNSLKNKIKKISLGGITTGNFIRGIKNN
mgnify:FL=1